MIAVTVGMQPWIGRVPAVGVEAQKRVGAAKLEHIKCEQCMWPSMKHGGAQR